MFYFMVDYLKPTIFVLLSNYHTLHVYFNKINVWDVEVKEKKWFNQTPDRIVTNTVFSDMELILYI